MTRSMFCLDVSTSTRNSPTYRETARFILNGLVANGDDIVPIAWSHGVNRKVTVANIFDVLTDTPSASAGTSVMPLVDYMFQRGDVFDKIVLVTDGRTGPSMLHYIKYINKRKPLPWKFAQVHFIRSLDDQEDVTVCAAAPFIFDTKYIVYVHDADKHSVVSQSDWTRDDVYKALSRVQTPADLDACFENVYARIVADSMIKSDMYLSAIVNVERLLLVNTQVLGTDGVTIETDVQKSFTRVQNMEYSAWRFYNALSQVVKARLDALRDATQWGQEHGYLLDAFGVVPSFKCLERPLERDLFETNIVECHLMCHVDVGEPISVPNDPLAILMDSNLIQVMASRMTTRDKGEPVYLTTDPELIYKTRCVLANMLGVEELHGYYALWILVFWVASDYPVAAASSVIDVLRAAKVPMSLSNSGYHPIQLVSVTDALLYVIESSRIWCMDVVWRDRLRALLPAYEIFRVILRHDGHDVSKFDSRVADLRLAAYLECEPDQYALRKRICSEFMEVYTYRSGDIALLDGLKSDTRVSLKTSKSVALMCNGYRVPYLDLGVPDVVDILNIGNVYTAKENSDVYAHEDTVTICPLTLRPPTHWKEEAEAKRGPVQKQISAHKHALDFYLENRRFPEVDNVDDMDTFVRMLERTYSSRGCLPRGVVCIARQIFQDMSRAMTERQTRDPSLCDPDVVIQHIKRGYDRVTRLAMEREWYTSV